MAELEYFNPDGAASVLVVCDHAGRLVPPPLDLGVGDDALARHIGWDIGAADLTRRLAILLDAPAILDHTSRLVIDPNRRPGVASSVPAVSDGVTVPGNDGLSADELADRTCRYWLPYHRAVARHLGRARGQGVTPVVIALHSFTPRLDGTDRPWQVGVLWRGDERIAAPALARLRGRGDLVVGDNQPYSGLAEFGYTIEFHAQRTGLPHVMFEVRQDEIDTREAAERWASILADALADPLGDPGLYAPFPEPRAAQAWHRYGFSGRP